VALTVSKETVSIFGSTGSIGTSTLDVLERNHARYQVRALTANSDVDAMFRQCLRFKPETVAMTEPAAANELSDRLTREKSNIRVLSGAALESTITAALCGKRILLANKESMVVAGELLTRAVKQGGASIIPVDSEHNAIFQCLPESDDLSIADHKGVTSIVLTASGGPFREHTLEQMQSVTVDEALSHPNWSMGPKVSIDSATLMNKGLEVIEASYLFGLDESRIEVVVHPESAVHSMVRYTDGSVLAQLGQPDMRTPIANALAWPDLAREALRRGAGVPGVLNAANEVAVKEFIAGHIKFSDISGVNSHVLSNFSVSVPGSVDDLLDADRSARQFALNYIEETVTSPAL